MKTPACIAALCALSGSQVKAFAPLTDVSKISPVARTQLAMSVSQQPPNDRRTFVGDFLSSSFGVAITAVVGLPVSPALAQDDENVEDLAMPTADEQKALDDAAMAERLRRKAELQKKMSRPMNYQESMKAEKDRQKDMKKSKAEMRAALCEELGRGC